MYDPFNNNISMPKLDLIEKRNRIDSDHKVDLEQSSASKIPKFRSLGDHSSIEAISRIASKGNQNALDSRQMSNKKSNFVRRSELHLENNS